MKFTKIPENTFQNMVLNAGLLLKNFDPETGTVSASDIIGATSGGINFTAVPAFSDRGEGIDNCPKNTKELKQLDSWDVNLSSTFVTINAEHVKSLLAAADVAGDKITPRNDLKPEDFDDMWLVSDYSDQNDESNGGFCAVHMINALSTGGFSMQTSDKQKGTFAAKYTAHYSIVAQDTPPFEAYVKTGGAAA